MGKSGNMAAKRPVDSLVVYGAQASLRIDLEHMNKIRTSTSPVVSLFCAGIAPLLLLGAYGLGFAVGWWGAVGGLWPLVWGWPPAALAFGCLRRSVWGTLTISMLLGLTLLIGAIMFNFEPVHVKGPSMQPTLYEGDVLLTDETRTRPERYGVFVVELPDAEGYPLVKRVVGLPGEHITARYYRIFADGEQVYPRDDSDPNTWYREQPARARLYSGGIHLGEDEYFVLGDNPPDSLDSRHFGAIRAGHIQGRVVWSLRGSHGFWPIDTGVDDRKTTAD